MRRLVRDGAAEVWILDLGGDSKGSYGAAAFAGGDRNIFDIRSGVAIAWVVFDRERAKGDTKVFYRRLYGTRSAKLQELGNDFDPSLFKEVCGSDFSPFIPLDWGNSVVESSPRLDELFEEEPDTGLQTARDSSDYPPVGTRREDVYARGKTIKGKAKVSLFGSLARWGELSTVAERRAGWRTAESDRRTKRVPLPKDLDEANVIPYVYRPLDERYLYNDESWVDWFRPELQDIYGGGQTAAALVTIIRDHGEGPSAMHVNKLMDQHCFRGSGGGKGVFVLRRAKTSRAVHDTRATDGDAICMLSSIVYDWLDRLGRPRQHDDAYNYILAVLSAPTFSQRFWRALEVDFLRVPLTENQVLFDRLSALGHKLRSIWEGDTSPAPGVAWQGTATTPLGKVTFSGNALEFDNGKRIVGVSDKVWRYTISGYPVVQRWFRARQHWTGTTMTEQMLALQHLSGVAGMLSLAPELDAALSDLIG